MESKLYIKEDGTKVWKLSDGTLHKEGKPAMVFKGGIEVWYINGLMHREDGPAYDSELYKEWWVNGYLHRENGEPAIIDEISNRKEWWVNGMAHRENDKPAIVVDNKAKEWWVNGKRHRENDEPAIIEEIYNIKEWWVNGIKHRSNDKPAVINNDNGGKEWWVNGKRHRSTGPAIIYGVSENGTTQQSKYYLEGKVYDYIKFKYKSREYKLNTLLNE